LPQAASVRAAASKSRNELGFMNGFRRQASLAH
jgi:hypothetical protein